MAPTPTRMTNLVFAEALSQSTFAGFIITVLVHTDMAGPHLHHAGSAAQKAKYLPVVTAGEMITAVGITEPGAGSDVAGIRTSARREGDDWVLNGTKMFITNGVHADLYFVAAKTGTRARTTCRMFIVEKGTPGFTRGPRAQQDGLALQRHRRAGVRRRAHPGRRTCWARRARASIRS